MQLSRQRLLDVRVLAWASVVCLALLGVRAGLRGPEHYRFLVWNLVLAWVPLALALLLDRVRRRRGSGPAMLGLGAVWLVFVPNAPYIVTDVVHLEPGSRTLPVDVVAIAAFAAVGLLLGVRALLLVHTAVAERFGERLGHLFVAGTVCLTLVGIWLGRARRFNSWDALSAPHTVFDDALRRLDDPFRYGEPLLVSLAATALWLAAYALLAWR